MRRPRAHVARGGMKHNVWKMPIRRTTTVRIIALAPFARCPLYAMTSATRRPFPTLNWIETRDIVTFISDNYLLKYYTYYTWTNHIKLSYKFCSYKFYYIYIYRFIFNIDDEFALAVCNNFIDLISTDDVFENLDIRFMYHRIICWRLWIMTI